MVGGMPESTFLTLTFVRRLFPLPAGGRSASGYGVGRSTQVLSFRSSAGTGPGGHPPGSVLRVHAAFLRLASTREPAWIHSRPAARSVWPVALYLHRADALWAAWHTLGPGLGGYGSLRGFMGVAQVLFAVVAVGSLARGKPRLPEWRIPLFFFVSAAVIVLKRYGVPIINWIGHLPFFRFILFPKYDESLLAFAMAVLCAIGMHQVLTAPSAAGAWLVARHCLCGTERGPGFFAAPGDGRPGAPPWILSGPRGSLRRGVPGDLDSPWTGRLRTGCRPAL